MGVLRFRVAEKQKIEFWESYISFIRGINQVKPTDITYSNATGQTVTANQILYTTGNVGTDGYVQVKATKNATLNGSGVFNVTLTHQPSSTQTNQAISFGFDNGNITIQLTYNSKPEALDIIKDIPNRSTYIFTELDFKNNYLDYDGNAIAQVAIFGDPTSYVLSSVSYIEGTWIPISLIEAGELKYIALNQNTYYEKDNNWKVKDINGNISLDIGNIKFKVAGFTCSPPTLVVTIIGAYKYKLEWDYAGVDYSSVDSTTTISILFSKGSSNSYQIVDVLPFTTQSYVLDDSVEANQIVYFKVQLLNRNCDEYSNEHGIIHQ